jgi:hypothetical protein
VPKGGEEDPKEIERVLDLDSEHGDPEPNPQPDFDDFIDSLGVTRVKCNNLGSK